MAQFGAKAQERHAARGPEVPIAAPRGLVYADRGAAARPADTVKPTKVLVVDDSELMHRMYALFLRGVSLVHARDGEEALERLSANADVDLVLLDINMPKKSGFEVLTALGERGVVPRLPVIVVTTEGREEDAARGLAAGAAAYLTKPFQADQIRAAISALPETVAS